jgi:23S rRNA (uracil1939-C5)-methyltransferase
VQACARANCSTQAPDYATIVSLLLTIEKLIYGGDGLARTALDAQGRSKAVFVPFVLGGEQVEARVVEEKPGFARACLEKLVKPSPARVEPRCPYFGRCGGCHYQHTGYEHQLAIKSAILTETIQRIAKIRLSKGPHVHSAEPWNYRNRTRMKVRGGTRFALGYYRFNSHELLSVEECPISSPLINRAIAALWKLGRAGAVPQHIEELEFFADHNDRQLLIEFNLDDHATNGVANAVVAFAGQLRSELPEIIGVAIFRREGNNLRHETPTYEQREALGTERMNYQVGTYKFEVSAGSFFQTNRHLTAGMMELVTRDRAGDHALDLYAGAGLFTVPLAENFVDVAAVEAAPYSHRDLRHNCPTNVSAYHETTEKFLATAKDIDRYDYVVVDPPRGGMGEAIAQQLAALESPRITYVSCDPATLARDLRVLLSAGYVIEDLHLFDLFPQTFHIESLVELKLNR